jgi:hypothetical protein
MLHLTSLNVDEHYIIHYLYCAQLFHEISSFIYSLGFLMYTLQGPEIRTGFLKDGKPIQLKKVKKSQFLQIILLRAMRK